MAGVVPALMTHDNVGLLGYDVDDFAFTYVAPLNTDDHDSGHSSPQSIRIDIFSDNRKAQ
jgi:hypothetical protein